MHCARTKTANKPVPSPVSRIFDTRKALGWAGRPCYARLSSSSGSRCGFADARKWWPLPTQELTRADRAYPKEKWVAS